MAAAAGWNQEATMQHACASAGALLTAKASRLACCYQQLQQQLSAAQRNIHACALLAA
jgi:hypothetical protein